jgi:hypothetical protein
MKGTVIALPRDEIPFIEASRYEGMRVKIIDYGDWGHDGMTGTIIKASRLWWADQGRLPYKTLHVLMDEDIHVKTNVAVCGVEHLRTLVEQRSGYTEVMDIAPNPEWEKV